MKSKILNLLLIISSLIGYLEWGEHNHVFLFQAELEILSKALSNTSSVLHPFTILPLLAQVLLFINLFKKKPSKLLTYLSIAGLGMLLGFMLLIGIMSLNYKIIIFSIPFIIVAVLTIRHYRKNKDAQMQL